LLTDSAVVAGQLAPFLVGRQAPTAVERAASLLRRLPGVQAPVPPAMLRRIVVAIGWRDGHAQVLGGPLPAIEHAFGRRRLSRRLRRTNGPEHETQRCRYDTRPN